MMSLQPTIHISNQHIYSDTVCRVDCSRLYYSSRGIGGILCIHLLDDRVLVLSGDINKRFLMDSFGFYVKFAKEVECR